jgi:hypothetical protein
MMDPYIHSPAHLHGVTLNQLSTGTTLPLHFTSTNIGLTPLEYGLRVLISTGDILLCCLVLVDALSSSAEAYRDAKATARLYPEYDGGQEQEDKCM